MPRRLTRRALRSREHGGRCHRGGFGHSGQHLIHALRRRNRRLLRLGVPNAECDSRNHSNQEENLRTARNRCRKPSPHRLSTSLSSRASRLVKHPSDPGQAGQSLQEPQSLELMGTVPSSRAACAHHGSHCHYCEWSLAQGASCVPRVIHPEDFAHDARRSAGPTSLPRLAEGMRSRLCWNCSRDRRRTSGRERRRAAAGGGTE